jgi:hypothetical protein
MSTSTSTLKVRKLPGFQAHLGKEPPKIEVPDDLPKLPMLSSYWGVRGSGKTVAATTLLRKYKDANLMQRLFVMTPTYESNKHLLEDLCEPEDVYSECTQESLDQILDKLDAEAMEWRRYKEHKMLWEAYQRQKKSYIAGKRKKIDDDLLYECFDAGLTDLDKMPPFKYTCNGSNHPQVWLFLDDCQNSSLFNSSSKVKNNLSNVLIKHRHLSGRYGLNIIIALQNYKSQTGVLSKAMRANMTCMGLFGYRDEKLLKGIREEQAGEIDEDTFKMIYDYATSGEKWHYLFIEFNPLRFRRCLDEIVSIQNISDKDDKDGTDKGAHDDHM